LFTIIVCWKVVFWIVRGIKFRLDDGTGLDYCAGEINMSVFKENPSPKSPPHCASLVERGLEKAPFLHREPANANGERAGG